EGRAMVRVGVLSLSDGRKRDTFVYHNSIPEFIKCCELAHIECEVLS
ncbi:MAG: hypothetical protein H6Q87_1619, partial [candidate division NC10 bacterium]|nr:hypothetical protein [candidate division NC10 bacterium]